MNTKTSQNYKKAVSITKGGSRVGSLSVEPRPIPVF